MTETDRPLTHTGVKTPQHAGVKAAPKASSLPVHPSLPNSWVGTVREAGVGVVYESYRFVQTPTPTVQVPPAAEAPLKPTPAEEVAATPTPMVETPLEPTPASTSTAEVPLEPTPNEKPALAQTLPLAAEEPLEPHRESVQSTRPTHLYILRSEGLQRTIQLQT